jgi:hypothetical protein
VEKLLGNYISKVFVDFELPFVEKLAIGEFLNQLIDAVEAILGFSYHVTTEITHLVCIVGESRWKGRFMATRRDQMNILASLLKLEDWLV